MDDIQRKLALIDKQLTAGPANLHRKIITTCPLVFVALGLITGILIQNAVSEPHGTSHEPQFLWFWQIVLTLFTAATITFFIIQNFSGNNKSPTANNHLPLTNYQYIIAYMALACFVCLGAIRLTSFYQPKPNDVRNLIADQRKLATIRGLIVTEPYINRYQNWQFARFRESDHPSSFYLKVSEIESLSGWTKVSGLIRVQVAEPVMDLKTGDYIQAYCWLQGFTGATNPGQFDIAKYLEHNGVFTGASIQSCDGIEILKTSQNSSFAKLKSKLRQMASYALVGQLTQQDQTRALLEALLLGYRRNIDSKTYQAFYKTGLLHFISLSGLHLGILIGIVWWLSKIAGFRNRARASICIIAICIFLLVVPPRPPTLRAAIIGLVFCASYLFRKRPNPFNTLSLAAIILLLIRPTMLFEPGWQLSFASVLGILLFTERIINFIYEKLTDYFPGVETKETKPYYQIVIKLGSYIFNLFAVGFAAWLGGAGILLFHFYTINPLTCLWTVIVFPLVALILTLGFFKIILTFILPTAAAALGIIVTISTKLFLLLVEFFARLDFQQILIGHVPLVPIILYYCFILFIGFVYFRRPYVKRVICIVTVCAMILFLSVTKWQRTYRDELIITVLDVGHGQVILTQLPGKENILFDAGSMYKTDIGRRIVAPFLNYYGIGKIDFVFISHSDIDHINGIPEITEIFKVNNVYANCTLFDDTNPTSPAKFLRDCLDKTNHKIKLLNRNFSIDSSAKIEILWPTEQICRNQTLGVNDKSTVLLIEFAGRKILICSDIENFAQQQLPHLYPNLQADIVVVPHHGSVKALDHVFLDSLDAQILICSCSQTAYEKQQLIKPSADTTIFYTATNGAVNICIDKKGGITTETFTKK